MAKLAALMKNLAATKHVLSAAIAVFAMSSEPSCGDITTPAFAVEDRAPTVDDVLRIMATIPAEACLYNPRGKRCDQPGGYERGPDARRIAEAIVANADGSIQGSRLDDAALYAVFTSFESGNNASAIGDGKRAVGCLQEHYVGDVALDPNRAVPIWRSIARGSLKACAANEPDERLASIAGSCSYEPARRKVRQRVQLARKVAAQLIEQ